MGLPQLPQVFPSGCRDADNPLDIDLTGIPQIPQNSSEPDSGFPHDRQTFSTAG